MTPEEQMAMLMYYIEQGGGAGANIPPYGDNGYVSTDEKRNQSFYGTYMNQMADIMNAALALDQGTIPLEAFAPEIEEETVELPGAAMRARYLNYDPASPEYLIAELHDQQLSPREIINNIMAIVTPVEGETREQAAQRENFASMFSRENQYGETFFDRDALEKMVLDYDKTVSSDPIVDDVIVNDRGIPTGIVRTETPSEMGEWWEKRGLTSPLVDYTMDDFRDPALSAAYDQYLQGEAQRAEAGAGQASVPELEAMLRMQLDRGAQGFRDQAASGAAPGATRRPPAEVGAQGWTVDNARPISLEQLQGMASTPSTQPDPMTQDRIYRDLLRRYARDDSGSSSDGGMARQIGGIMSRVFGGGGGGGDTPEPERNSFSPLNMGSLGTIGPVFSPQAQETAKRLSQARERQETNRNAQRRAYSDYFNNTFKKVAGTPNEYDRLRRIDQHIRGTGNRPWQDELAARQAQMIRAGVPLGF